MGILEDILSELKSINQYIQEQTLAITTQIINVQVVQPNSPPQYRGPQAITNAVVGQTYNESADWFDPDGDPITYSMEPSSFATIDVNGVITWTGQGTGTITVHADDGK